MITNWKELKSIGIEWDKFCKVTNTNEWARNEGLMTDDCNIYLNFDEIIKLFKEE